MDELTLGIEEEYQLIDPQSRELTSYVQQFLEHGSVILRNQVKPEFMQSQVEVGSHVCRNIKEVRQEVIRLRSQVAEIAAQGNRKIISAGTHPFSRWIDQDITDRPRYHSLLDELKFPIRRLLIFGMHVHIGIPDVALRMDIFNQIRYFLPHILTLSVSSPFWQGHNTGLQSYRSVVFKDLPRTGIPEYFASHEEHQNFVQTLLKTESIDDPTKIWWDVRVHPTFPTLEVRICDAITRVDEVVSITALIQAVAAKLIQLRNKNQSWRNYRRELIVENKWRAVRDGINGELLDLGIEKAVPTRSLINELLELVDDVSDSLGSRDEIEHIYTILKEGTSADRQLRRLAETGDLKAVVDLLAEETVMGC